MDGDSSAPRGGDYCSAWQAWAAGSSAVLESVKTEEEEFVHPWSEQPVQNDPSVLHTEERLENDESTQISSPPVDVARRGGRDKTKRTTSAGVTSSSGYPGVSWNRRMGAWLAFFYDAESRRSRTFHPKYYDFDVEAARLAAIEFMKTVENRERPKRSARSVDTSNLGPRKRASPPHKSKARTSQPASLDHASDIAEGGATFEAVPTQSAIPLLSECLTDGQSNASDSHLSVSTQAPAHEYSVSTMASAEPQEWQLAESRAAEVCEIWTHPYVKCDSQQAEAIGEEVSESEALREEYVNSCHLMSTGSFQQLESVKREGTLAGECRLCVAAEAEYEEQLESSNEAGVDVATQEAHQHSHGEYEGASLPQVQEQLGPDEAQHPADGQSIVEATETKAGDDDSNHSTYAPSSRHVGVGGSETTTGERMTDEHDMEEDSCQEADPESHGSTSLSRAASDVMSELMPRVDAASPCSTEDRKKLSAEGLLQPYSTDSVVYPNQSSEFFPLQSMTLAEELSGDMTADRRADSGLQESGGDTTGNEGGGHDQLPAWLAEDLASAGNAIASAGGNLHRAVLDRRGSWRGLARLRSQDSISAFMGGRADLMFTGLEGIRPMNGSLSRSSSMTCIQDPTIPPLYMNLKTECREDGPLRKVPSGPLGKIGSDGFPDYLSSRGGASPIADHRKGGSFKPVNTCLASDCPMLENVWDSTGESQHYTSCSACP